VLAAVASCNLKTRSVFRRLYDREERRLEEATERIGDLEKELTRGGLETPEGDEFQRFHESRVRFERESRESNLKALHVVELKEAIGEVLGRFELTGLAADDIDEVLDLVEEVESDAAEDAFWKPYLDRILSPVEMYDDGSGPLRTDLDGLENPSQHLVNAASPPLGSPVSMSAHPLAIQPSRSSGWFSRAGPSRTRACAPPRG
jgi:hypothetical protein